MENTPLDLAPVPEGTPLTFDTLARAYLEDYVLQRYRTMSTGMGHYEISRSEWEMRTAATVGPAAALFGGMWWSKGWFPSR